LEKTGKTLMSTTGIPLPTEGTTTLGKTKTTTETREHLGICSSRP